MNSFGGDEAGGGGGRAYCSKSKGLVKLARTKIISRVCIFQFQSILEGNRPIS